MRRGQVPLPVLEAAIGVLLLLALVLVLVTGTPSPDEGAVQLDAYAEDVGVLLRSQPPRHANGTRLAELAASPAAFERERDALDRRMRRLLPDNLLYRVRTEHGSVGHSVPDEVHTGTATVPTVNGRVVVRVWYA
jgi:hypothetical protein